MYTEKLSERKRILKTLLQVRSIISDVLEYIRERQSIEAMVRRP